MIPTDQTSDRATAPSVGVGARLTSLTTFTSFKPGSGGNCGLVEPSQVGERQTCGI